MCVLSVVYDKYDQIFPRPTIVWSRIDNDHWQKTIDDFRREVKDAKEQDRRDGNPDCEDPDKAKLEERVAALERELERLKKSGKGQTKKKKKKG
jgi:uncharacterized small protein (DUF1192 family)